MPALEPNLGTELYNLTNISSSRNILETTQHINNELTGGLFGVLVIISFFLILFISLKSERISLRFTAASFVTTIVAMLLRVAGFSTDFLVLLFVLLTALGFVIAKYAE